MLYLAMSCLQGREMQSAAAELLSLGVKGLQLTPGNAPTPRFQEWLKTQNIVVRTHHGFHWQALRQNVWSDTAECLVKADSVHPPQVHNGICHLWKQKAAAGYYAGILMETMYPGYCLGNGEEIQWAMERKISLSVDVSHIYIQLSQGCLTAKVWRKLQTYEWIGELHLSANNGRRDIHQPIDSETFGLAWVKERAQDEIPIVLECYMHRLSKAERLEQVSFVLEACE